MGCYEQERVEHRVYGPVPDADSYELDMYMIAELSGRFLPQRMRGSIYLCKENEDANEDGNENGDDVKCPSDSKGWAYGFDGEKAMTFDFDDFSDQSKGGECQFDLIWKPYQAENLSKSNDSSYDLDEAAIAFTFRRMLSTDEKANGWMKDLGDNYSCYEFSYEYHASGLDNIYRVWEQVWGYKDEDKSTSIRVASGDSYGVSIPQSSSFNDIPTALSLNKIGFTADTFGNHSFDQNLSYMNGIIDVAEYEYVISNLGYMAQNIHKPRQYTVFRVPAKGDTEHNPLLLGIFGVIDPAVVRSVFPGRFGTIEFPTSYCPLIQSMEDAYNKNVRAFMILAHVYSEPLFINKFLNELYILDNNSVTYDFCEVDIDKLYDAPDMDVYLADIESYEHLQKIDQGCYSKLYIDDEELDEMKRNHPGLSNEEAKNRLIIQKRKEIFNGIIGIMGDGSGGAPTLYEFTRSVSSEAQDWAENLLCWETDFSSQMKDKNGGTDLNRLERAPNPLGIIKDVADIRLYRYNKTFDTQKKSHSLWYWQIPTNGEHIGKAKVVVEKVKSDELEAGRESYQTRMVSYLIEPVIGKNYEGDSPKACDEFLTALVENPNCSKAFSRIPSVDSTVDGGDPDTVKDMSLRDLVSWSRQEEQEEPWRKACYEEIVNYKKSDAEVDVYKLLDNEFMKWGCLYNRFEKLRCKEKEICDGKTSKDGFYYVPKLYEFGVDDKVVSVAPESKEDDIRQKTTVVGNIVTLSILDFYRSKEDGLRAIYEAYLTDSTSKPVPDGEMSSGESEKGESVRISGTGSSSETPIDFLYFNAGSLRATFESYSAISQEWAITQMPYRNTVTSLHNMSAKEIVDMLEFGISKVGDGAFPLVNGIVFSHAKNTQSNPSDGNKSDVICEVWKTRLDYSALKDGNSSPGSEKEIFNLLDELIYYNFSSDCKGKHLAKLHINEDKSDKVEKSDKGGELKRYEIVVNEAPCFDYSKVKTDGDFKVSFYSQSKIEGLDFDELKDEKLYSGRGYRFLVPDYMATGGDGYGKYIKATKRLNFTENVQSTDLILGDYFSAMQEDLSKMKSKKASFTSAFNQLLCLNNVFYHNESGDYSKKYVNNSFCEATNTGNVSGACFVGADGSTSDTGKTEIEPSDSTDSGAEQSL